MKTNHRHYILFILAIITAVVSITVYIFIYRRTISQAAESSRAKAEEIAANKETQYVSDIEKTYASSAEERSRIASYLVSQEKIVRFIEAAEAIGTTAGVKFDISALDSANFQPQSEDEIGSLKAHIEMQGPWTDIMRALALLENMPYSISLNNVKLVKAAESSETVDKKVVKVILWNMSLDIRTLITK